MKKKLLVVFLFSAFLSGCDKIKSYSGFQNHEVVFDTISLQKIADSIAVHAEKQDSTYCDSLLLQFNHVELAKQHPRLVVKAYNWDLVSHSSKSARVFKQLNDLVAESGNEYLKAWNNYLIGRREQSTENYKEAIQQYLEALPQFEKYHDTLGLVLSNKRLGMMYRYYENNGEQGLKHYHRVLQLTNDSSEINAALVEIKNCYDGLNMPDSVVYYIHRLKEFNYQNGEEFINNYLGYELEKMSQLVPGSEDSVKKYYQLFLAIQTSHKNYPSLIFSHMEYGLTLLQLNRFKEAEQILSKGLAYSDSCPDCIKENGELYTALFNLYDTLGNASLALKYLKLKNECDAKFSFADLRTELKNGEENFRFKQEQQSLKLEQEKKDIQLSAERKQKYFLIAGLILVMFFAGIFFSQRNRIKKGKKLSDELLLNILPLEVAEELKAKGSADAKQFDDVTVMFTDFKNFTQISEKLSPTELVNEIHECFKAFDEIIAKHTIEKIKTIGDSYMCAGGLPVMNKTNAIDVVSAAMDIQNFMQQHSAQRFSEGKEVFEIRIGVHTGPVVAGIVGVKKFAYDIWGDTVNIASRMESSGEAGKVNISGRTYELVKDKFNCTHRGKIQAKNKGEIDMYFVEN
ncbi:MAG: adenylate/guanylate cyclase domain-containing protein [Bacteroidota bacterium]